MAYPVRDFLPGRRLVVAGAAATLISATTALAEISSSLIKGAMKRFKLTTPPRPMADLEFLDRNDQPVLLSELTGQALCQVDGGERFVDRIARTGEQAGLLPHRHHRGGRIGQQASMLAGERFGAQALNRGQSRFLNDCGFAGIEQAQY